jgi:hypothetical protein
MNGFGSFFGWHGYETSLIQWYERYELSSSSSALKSTRSEQSTTQLMVVVVVVVVVYIVYMNVFASVQRGTKVGLL